MVPKDQMKFSLKGSWWVTDKSFSMPTVIGDYGKWLKNPAPAKIDTKTNEVQHEIYVTVVSAKADT